MNKRKKVLYIIGALASAVLVIIFRFIYRKIFATNGFVSLLLWIDIFELIFMFASWFFAFLVYRENKKMNK